MIRRLIVPLAVAAVTACIGQALAQDAVPAPLSQAGPADQCRSGFVPLREEAEKRGKLIKVASERHAPAEEACKLIGNYGKAELMMIEYVQTHLAQCGIPLQVAEQLRAGHKNTDAMERKVCAYAQQVQQLGPSGPMLGPSGPLGDWESWH